MALTLFYDETPDGVSVLTQVFGDIGGTLYLGSSSNASGVSVPLYSIPTAGGSRSVVGANTFVDPETGAVGPDGAIYAVANSGPLDVYRLDLGTDTKTTWSLAAVYHPSFTSDGRMWAAAKNSSTTLVEISADGVTTTNHTVPSGSIYSVTVANDIVYVPLGDDVYSFDPATNTWLLVINWSASPLALTAYSTESIAHHNGRLYVLDSTATNGYVFSCTVDGSDPALEIAPSDLTANYVQTVAAVGDVLYLVDVDFTNGSYVWAFDLAATLALGPTVGYIGPGLKA